MRLLPNDKSLVVSFPEIKIIHYMKLAKTYLPPAIVVIFVWQYYMHSQLAITIITALFAISLPIQGIFVLGRRALAPLPLNLLSWYNHLKLQLIEKEVLPKKDNTPEPINFLAFIKLINLAKLHLGSYFGDNQNNDGPFIQP